MSDLVERLRKLTGDVPPRGHVVLAEEAADRIETLEAALRRAYDFLQDKSFTPDELTHECTKVLEVMEAALAPEQDK
jgi:hypothetical protein